MPFTAHHWKPAYLDGAGGEAAPGRRAEPAAVCFGCFLPLSGWIGRGANSGWKRRKLTIWWRAGPTPTSLDSFTSGLVLRTHWLALWEFVRVCTCPWDGAKPWVIPGPSDPQGYQFRAGVTSHSQIFLKLLSHIFRACFCSPAEP